MMMETHDQTIPQFELGKDTTTFPQKYIPLVDCSIECCSSCRLYWDLAFFPTLPMWWRIFWKKWTRKHDVKWREGKVNPVKTTKCNLETISLPPVVKKLHNPEIFVAELLGPSKFCGGQATAITTARWFWMQTAWCVTIFDFCLSFSLTPSSFLSLPTLPWTSLIYFLMSEARKPSQTSSHIPQIPASSENSARSTPSPQDGVQKQVRARRRNKKRKRGETNISTTDTPGHTPWLESLGMTEYESKNQRWVVVGGSLRIYTFN